MTTITLEVEPSAFRALRMEPSEFADEIRVAAAVQWYAEGKVSQAKGAELAGMSRMDFLNELHRRKVPTSQVTAEELRQEIA